MKEKFINYEKNFESLTILYHQIASSKNVMSKDLKIAEKKLKRKNETIKEIEKQLSVTRD